VQAAVEGGDGSARALARRSGETLARGCVNGADAGGATLASLQDAFPELARAAIATARETLAGDDAAERGMSFLQRQLGMRSLAPRDGDGADAVLSRAQAAVLSGDLAAALAEIASLEDGPTAVLADWSARAQARVDAVAGVDALAASLTSN